MKKKIKTKIKKNMNRIIKGWNVIDWKIILELRKWKK